MPLLPSLLAFFLLDDICSLAMKAIQQARPSAIQSGLSCEKLVR